MAEAKIKCNQNTTALCNLLKKSVKQYPCLNKKQEREMIEKYRNDRTELNKLLVMHNIRLVFNFAKHYMSKTDDYDTMIQDGMLGLAEAAKRFDINKDIKFSTCAFIWIKKYILMRFTSRAYRQDKMTVSLDEPSLTSGMKQGNSGNELTFENYVNEYMDPCDEPAIKSTDVQLSSSEMEALCENLYSSMEKDSSLSATDKAVFTSLFVEREKSRDVADRFNISPKEVSEIKKKVLSKFKDILERMGITSMEDVA